MTQRKRWLKNRELEKGVCVAVRRPGKADADRNARRPPFVWVLVWVYFVHERFESGFRDLTLCVKVLRREDQKSKIQNIFFTNIIFKTYFTKQKKARGRMEGKKVQV